MLYSISLLFPVALAICASPSLPITIAKKMTRPPSELQSTLLGVVIPLNEEVKSDDEEKKP